ncbi:Type II secretion system protein F [bacterium HR34]|nr:Type II secretion system protein F [bacterium HR34]
MKFKYQARNKDGKLVSGIVEAPSKEAAIYLIQEKGLFLTFLEQKEEGGLFSKTTKITGKISQKDIMVFFRQLATMVGAGIPLVEALKSLADQSDKKILRETIQNITKEVEAGSPLSSVLEKYPQYFSELIVGLLKAGEASGTLAKSLEYLAEYLENENYIYSKIKSALAYPAFIVVAMIGIIFILAFFVLPNLLIVFESVGTENLPITTKIIISSTNIIRSYGMYILMMFGFILFLLYRYFFQTIEGKKTLSKILYSLPIIKNTVRKIYVSRFAEVFSTLLLSGIPITSALEISSTVIGDEVYKKIILVAKEEVKKGEKLSSVLSQFSPQYLDPIFVRMIYVGESSGKLGDSLKNLVKVYRNEVESSIEGILSLMEPAIMVLLGGVVGIIVISILLPMYQNLMNTGF